MSLGWNWNLYLPAEHVFSNVEAVRLALIEGGFANPGGDGSLDYGDTLLEALTRNLYFEPLSISVEAFDEPKVYGARRGPGPDGMYSRCPECNFPAAPGRGRNPMTGATIWIGIRQCSNCGTDYDQNTWKKDENGDIFRSHFIVTLHGAGGFDGIPKLRDHCPEFVTDVEKVVGNSMEEALIYY